MNEKPIEMVVSEFNAELVHLVNSSNLPPFILSFVLSAVLSEVNKLADEQYRRAADEYEKRMVMDDGDSE